MSTQEAMADVREWQEQRRERAWDQALYSFRTATETIAEMAQLPEYRQRAIADLEQMSGAILAAYCVWQALDRLKKEAA